MADRTRVILPPKAERKRAAHAELLLLLSMEADLWAKQLRSRDVLPFDQWPEDDPLRVLACSYSLTAEDLARLADTLADQLEGRAIRAGYGELPALT